MNVRLKNRIAVWLPAFSLAASLGLVLLLDKAVYRLLENVRTVQLSQEAEHGQATIDAEIAALGANLSRYRQQITGLVSRTLPTVDDVRALQSRYGLRLASMDRLVAAAPASGPTDYRLLLTGSSCNLVKFLRDMETTYVARTATLAMQPVNEDGSIVAMEITLQLMEQ
jgi:hypothetical protein